MFDENSFPIDGTLWNNAEEVLISSMLRRFIVNTILRARFHWVTVTKPSISQRCNQLFVNPSLTLSFHEIIRNLKLPESHILHKMCAQVSSPEPKEDVLSPPMSGEESLEEARLEYDTVRQGCANKWLVYNKTCHIYLYKGGGEPREALAAFDLDGTIIKPKSRGRVPKSATDWQFFSVWTKVKLQQVLRENNARFVIFTNQNGVGLKLVTLNEIQQRIELVTKRLDIPCTVFIATEKDDYRKPNLGMYRLLEESFQGSVTIDLKKSFYCGDAIGYPSHSDADIKFAQALGLPFLPPDKFLRGVKPKLVAIDGVKS